WSFQKMEAGGDAADRFLTDQKIVESGIGAQYIGIGRIARLGARAEFTWRIADDRARRAEHRLWRALRHRQTWNQRNACRNHAAAQETIRHAFPRVFQGY